MSVFIKSAFLRLSLGYYGNFSLQLRPVNLKRKQNFFNLCWNVIAIFLGVYCIASRAYAREQTKHQLLNSFQHRPLFTLAFNIFLKSVLPIAFFVNVGYFIKLSFGDRQNQLVTLLDSFLLDFSIKNFVVVFIIDHILFINTYFYFITSSTDNLGNDNFYLIKCFYFIVNYFSFYLLSSNGFIIIGVVFYYKYATLVSLKTTLLELNVPSSDSTFLKFQQVENTIFKLSCLNSHLNNILSLPLLIILFAHIFNILVLLARVFVSGQFFYRNAVYVASNTLALFSLAFLQKHIQQQLTKLELSIQTTGSLQLKAHMMITVYRKYFDLRLFQLVSINLNLFLKTVLFVTNYVILIVQTSN